MQRYFYLRSIKFQTEIKCIFIADSATPCSNAKTTDNMDWNRLISTDRLGSKNRGIKDNASLRPEFQKDYDRLVFSSPFRRLQDKTQVFPLPGSTFVHNRLTHSLEVASIGKTLGDMVSMELEKRETANTALISEMGTIVSTACLAHDLGNPPFGHSGESAISRYFQTGNGLQYRDQVTENEWNDLQHFEGNANAFRILAHSFKGRRQGGYAMTYSTLASLVKYPFPSTAFPEKNKYGFFHSEIEAFTHVANELGIPLLDEEKKVYARYPLVYLVEAADDIAYQLMDLEDAHKLRILDTKETEELFLQFFDKTDDEWFFNMKESVYQEVIDTNERIAFLRSLTISKLIKETQAVFMNHHTEIMEGIFEGSLVKHLKGTSGKAMKAVQKISVQKIYRNPEVISIELAGYNILGTLLEEFIPAVIEPSTDYHKKLISLIPEQYHTESSSVYHKIQTVLDFVSNMTDLYAVKLYKDIKGISLV
jgi:dGTPase